MPQPAPSDKSGVRPKVNSIEKNRVAHGAKALKEAEERARRLDEQAKSRPRECNGPEGPDPARYGDWEVNGIASDF